MSIADTPERLQAARDGDNEACTQILEDNAGLIWSVVRRYYGRGVEPDDLYNGGQCDLRTRARAYAAAGSDARMNGCELPVCIISGSGNQGMTASVPVVVYARAWYTDEETLLRALLVSNLITVHQKTGIG